MSWLRRLWKLVPGRIRRYLEARFKDVSTSEARGYAVWGAMGVVVGVPEIWAAIEGDDFYWPTISTTIGHLQERWPVVALLPVAAIVMGGYSVFRIRTIGDTVLQADLQGLGPNAPGPARQAKCVRDPSPQPTSAISSGRSFSTFVHKPAVLRVQDGPRGLRPALGQLGPVVRSAGFVLGERHRVRILAVVPVRYGATRFPGKPLADLDGRPVVQWVYEAAAGCPAYDEVIVATDNDEIAARVREFGGAFELTRDDHPSGTDRVAEVAERHPEADVVVNVQGDQPFATEEMLGALVAPYLADERPPVTTLACPLVDPDWWDDPNVVKVVRDAAGYALYFSRSSIPYGAADKDAQVKPLHHLGLYAFTRETLLRFPQLAPTPLELQERLEQLRALEHGIRILVCDTERPVLEVNTPEDLEQARRLVRERADAR